MQEIRATVSQELELVNQLIIEQLHSDIPLVENVGHYIVNAGGKRLRPLLVLLSGAALGSCRESHIRFAAVIEFIHTATLLHDDVVDVSELRRGRPTVNAKFGNAPSVLVGDFLYTRAFQLMVELQDMRILRHMADTTNTIAEGEVLQLTRAGDTSTTEQQYLDVITRKTAVLFAAACYGAARLSGVDEALCATMRAFGLSLGTAFQIVDDVLDYRGTSDTMGKNIGDDLAEGKMTLPLIHALQNAPVNEQALIREAVENRNPDRLNDIVKIVESCGALRYAEETARRYHDLAAEKLATLQETPYTEALHQVLARSIRRDH